MTDNAAIISAHYDGYARGDFAAVLAPRADDVTWIEAEGFPLAGTYRGRQAVVDQVFARLQRDWEDFTFRSDEILDAGAAMESS